LSLLPTRSLSRFGLLCLSLGTLAGLPALTPTPAIAQASVPKEFTFDSLFGGAQENLFGSLPYITRWLKDGQHYLEYGYDSASNGPALMRVNAKTGVSKPFFDPAQMQQALAAQPGFGAGNAGRVARSFRFNFDKAEEQVLIEQSGDLYTYRFATGVATRLTKTPNERETNAAFSPDGKMVSYVLKGNLYACPIAAPDKVKQLTRDGSAKILNGRLDWVYEEELYGRGNTGGYAWSPDSKSIVYLRSDESPVPNVPIINHLPDATGPENQFYPMAGQPNPTVTVGVATVDGVSAPRFLNVSKYPDAERLVVRFGWTPDSRRVLLQVQNRSQTWLDLVAGDPLTGKTTALFRETSPAWVEALGENGANPVFLKDGSFLWLSDRTGYRHLYRYKPDGALVGAVTKGDWDVQKVHGVDEKEGIVCFDASERSFIAHNAYRVPLDGSGKLTRLTDWEGNHETDFSPTLAYFMDTWSRAGEPEQLRVHDGVSGQEVRLLGDNGELKKSMARYKISKPELVKVKARDGFVLDAMLIKPTNFDPNKKYPVICPVYGGPAAPKVHDSWGYDFWEYQAWAQKGYIVWVCDNRSASGKGAKSAWTVYKNFGPGELRDVEDGLDYLAAQGWADMNRVGISGWSFGGFLVQYALTHSKRFKVGVAGAGVSDWKLYDSIYTERYMDTPDRNPEGYTVTSPSSAAAALSGKLLLIHGLMDDNVHVQNTLQLAYALQKAGKRFDMMLYPGPRARHGFSDPQLNRHEKKLEIDYITENL
jgi:dipeptidyl-peptidase-4